MVNQLVKFVYKVSKYYHNAIREAILVPGTGLRSASLCRAVSADFIREGNIAYLALHLREKGGQSKKRDSTKPKLESFLRICPLFKETTLEILQYCQEMTPVS